MSQTVEIAVSLGSNVPNAHEQVLEAVLWLHETVLTDMRTSDTYCTPAHNATAPPYINAVAIGRSIYSVTELTTLLKRYEQAHGPRLQHLVPIDMDVVVCDNAVLRPADFGQTYFTVGWKQLQNI